MRREYQVVGRQGRAALRQFLAKEGAAHPGRPDGAIRRHGEQGGIVALGGQKVQVSRPRLRRKAAWAWRVPGDPGNLLRAHGV